MLSNYYCYSPPPPPEKNYNMDLHLIPMWQWDSVLGWWAPQTENSGNESEEPIKTGNISQAQIESLMTEARWGGLKLEGWGVEWTRQECAVERRSRGNREGPVRQWKASIHSPASSPLAAVVANLRQVWSSEWPLMKKCGSVSKNKFGRRRGVGKGRKNVHFSGIFFVSNLTSDNLNLHSLTRQ